MDHSFVLFVIFSFILIALLVFVVFFFNQLKQIKGHFKWSQSIIYVLGSICILISLTLSYFIYLHFSLTFAIVIFAVLNGMAIFLLYRASLIFRRVRRDFIEPQIRNKTLRSRNEPR